MSPSHRARRIATLVLAVVLVAVIAAGGFLGFGFVQQRRQKETAIRLIDLSRVLLDYERQHHGYPESEAAALASITPIAERAEAAGLELVDAWGHPLTFVSDGRDFLLWSTGRNGAIDRFAGGGRRKGVDVDLVVYDGKFWQLPHGI